MNPRLFADAVEAIASARGVNSLTFHVPPMGGWSLVEKIELIRRIQLRWKTLTGRSLPHEVAESFVKRGSHE